MTDETPMTDAEFFEMGRKAAEDEAIAAALELRDFMGSAGFRIPIPNSNLVLSLWPKEGEK